MDGQMNIFDFPEYLPDEHKSPAAEHEGSAYKIFHEHCIHRGWHKPATETEPSMWMCSYATGHNAQCWDDWIPCTEQNCILTKQ